MYIYILVFIIALFYYYSSKKSQQSQLFLAFFFIYVSLFVGLGDMIGGYDRYIYGEAFDYIADEMHSTSPNLSKAYYLVGGTEYLFFYWEVLLTFITGNRYIFIFITSLLIYFLFYRAFVKYLEDYPLSCIIFLGFFFYFTMTYLRQVIAVGIVWQGIEYIWNRKKIKFFIFIILGYFVHSSTLVFALFYFVPLKKFTKKEIILFLVISFLIGLTPLPSALIDNASSAVGKGNYQDQDQGFRIEYIFEVIFFVWIYFKNYAKIASDKKTVTFLNMSFVLCGLLLIFMRFGQGGRLGWFFLIGVFYMLPYLANQKNAFIWMKPLVILMSFILFMRMTISWAPLNVPYKTFLTPGEPAGDGSTFIVYEYDFDYVNNKFHR